MPDAGLRRPPLDAAEVVVPPDGPWRRPDVVRSTPSSNADLARLARRGAPPGTLIVAEEQTSGRGRRGRTWSAPAYSSLMVSGLLRPGADPATWGWLPLLTVVALAEAVQSAGVRDPQVKWPNDLLVGEAKLAGVLCEVVPTDDRSVVVAGWGLNVSQARDELPDGATSLALLGAGTDRVELLNRVLDRWSHWYRTWESGDVEATRAAYARQSATLGSRVRALLPDGSTVEGRATALADGGGLVVVGTAGEVTIAAADVVHLRPVPGEASGGN